ncbi:MAG: PIN domain-containing protein [Synergistaceae bacterium]|nr:PIN domain-containing protein [Synergistaceae bacterium]
MINAYVLDACAVTAIVNGENGGEVVGAVIEAAYNGRARVMMNIINLLEVYYDKLRSLGKSEADKLIAVIKKQPIVIVSEISASVFVEAGRIKANYRISLADSIAIAEALTSGAILVTSDHHEMDEVEANENIKFLWIR